MAITPGAWIHRQYAEFVFKSDCRERDMHTLRDVEDRLIAAAWIHTRLPDKENGFHHVKAAWPSHKPEWTEYNSEDRKAHMIAKAKRTPVTVDEFNQLDEANAWLTAIKDPRDRAIVMCACISRMGEVRTWENDAVPQTKFNWDTVRKIIHTHTSHTVDVTPRHMARRYRIALGQILVWLNPKTQNIDKSDFLCRISA